jgi:hypothetical protein
MVTLRAKSRRVPEMEVYLRGRSKQWARKKSLTNYDHQFLHSTTEWSKQWRPEN